MPRKTVSPPNDSGTLLVECREALGLRQVDLAERLQVNKRTVAYWEAGSSEGPSFSVWWALYYWLKDVGADPALIQRLPVSGWPGRAWDRRSNRRTTY